MIYKLEKFKITDTIMNGQKGTNEDTGKNRNKSKQVFFTVALLILWLLVYLAIHYKILKN